MRFMATLLLWVLTTAALLVAIPATWAQHNAVDGAGYSQLATSAAKDPNVQSAMAEVLTTQLVQLAGRSGYDVTPNLLGAAARSYTSSSAFPGQFALANQLVHRWLFTDAVAQSDASGRWELDLSPMLSDSSFQQTLQDYGITAPKTLELPLTEHVSDSLRPGQLRQAATWGPWVSVGSAILTGVLALLTLATARSRGKALGALGVSALLVAAAGWAGIEMARGRVDDLLNGTNADVRQLATAMVDHAIGSMHMWLNLTLAVGGALVVLGVVFAVAGGMRRGA
ncbi:MULTISPECIES: hypothetical protein [unclassified Mycobacterium]|uniref:hypothetical protein n=1 Tax=unclassified Mycobacterium TaxID=2642494 RepID=UPI0029C91F03|nr:MULTISPECIES: hypothetical protein [unclassified Mycobacterium]